MSSPTVRGRFRHLWGFAALAGLPGRPSLAVVCGVDRSVEVMLLHALPFDSAMWLPVREQLEDRDVRVSAPNLYALGSTTSEWASRLLMSTASSPLILVGCSVGGSCALDMAALAPGRVVAMVLIGTKANRRPDPAAHRAALALLEAGHRTKAWERYWQPLFGSSAGRDVVDAAHEVFEQQSIEHLIAGVDAFHTRAGRLQIVRELRHPVVFVSGSEDPAPGVATNRLQADAAVDGRLHVVKGAGHYLPLEAPDAIVDLVMDLADERTGLLRHRASVASQRRHG